MSTLIHLSEPETRCRTSAAKSRITIVRGWRTGRTNTDPSATARNRLKQAQVDAIHVQSGESWTLTRSMTLRLDRPTRQAEA